DREPRRVAGSGACAVHGGGPRGRRRLRAAAHDGDDEREEGKRRGKRETGDCLAAHSGTMPIQNMILSRVSGYGFQVRAAPAMSDMNVRRSSIIALSPNTVIGYHARRDYRGGTPETADRETHSSNWHRESLATRRCLLAG